jgi:heat shock protein HslJ
MPKKQPHIFMEKLLFFVAILSLSISVTSCNNDDPKDDVVTATQTMLDSPVVVTDAHSAQNALDWSGNYKGVLPCADCQGIATEITLDKDFTYTIKTSYVGKEVKSTEEKGVFKWNMAGNTITLLGIAKKPDQYFVGENYLAQMDMDGKRITGDLAGKYLLAKQQPVMASAMADSSYKNAALLETYWKLVTLNGQPIEKPAEGKIEIHIILKQKDHRLQGFAGCNSIMGLFELKEGNFIGFKNIASTRMACPDMKAEDAFKKVLEQVDNFTISGDNLSLNKAKMAPLATFRAVYLK